jgi:hypothetical protein
MNEIKALSRREVDLEPTKLRFPGPKRIAVELSARLISLEKGGSFLGCPHCACELNLHQPDESSPDQLLATCDACSRWYTLVDIGDGTSSLMIEFPSKSTIEKAYSRGAADR